MIIRGCIVSKEENTFLIETYGCQYTIVFSVDDIDVFNKFKKLDTVVMDTKDVSLTKINYEQEMNIEIDGYSMVKELSVSTYKDIFGVVLSSMPLCATRGTDYLFTLEIIDESAKVELKIFIGSINEIEKFVCPEETSEFDADLDYTKKGNFEKIFKTGDILLLRNIKLMRNGNMALIHKSCVIKKMWSCNKDINEIDKNIKDYMVIKNLYDFYLDNHCVKRHDKKRRRIEELEENIYFDIVCRILYVDHGYMVNVCVTDYTHSKLVPRIFKGIYELSTLLYIRLYGKYADMGRLLKVGDTCIFRNVRINTVGDCLLSHISESKTGSITIEQDRRMINEIIEREKVYKEYLQNRVVSTEDDEVGNEKLCTGNVFNKKDLCNNRMNRKNKDTGPCSNKDTEPCSNKDTGPCGNKDTGPCSNKNTELTNQEENIVVDFINLRDMNAPGIYFAKIKMEQYCILNTEKGKCLELVISDSFTAMRVIARQRLTKILADIDMDRLKNVFRCMILCIDSKPQRNFLVNVFLDDKSMKNFMNGFS